MSMRRTRHLLPYLFAFVLFLVAVSLIVPRGLWAQGLGWDATEQARSHSTDVSHIEMHIRFDQPQKKVMGTVYHTLTLLPSRVSPREVVFDALDLSIEKVWVEQGHVEGKIASGKMTPIAFDTTEAGKLHLTLDRVYPYGEPVTVGITYSGHPKKGMYFISSDTFYTTRLPEVWTQGEGEDNHHWLPCYDYPNDKVTTDMYVSVAEPQKALSNGRLVSKDKNKDGTITWHWKEEHPFATYLIMLGVGEYDVVKDKWRTKDVDYWVYPGWGKEAMRIFGLTPKMMEFFSVKTGIPYPWEKYDQIAIEDFMYGGMENVTATTLNDYVLYDKRQGVDFNSEGLIAHELAHQWFGDLITCRSWMHTWVNESFATYFEALFRESYDGKDEFDEEMYGAQQGGMGAEVSLGKKPIVAPSNYTANLYPRGAATLNMMRHVLGDSGWWTGVHHYLDVHKFTPVTTEDFKMGIEEATGQNLQWFFDEWLYKSGHPNFDVTSEWDEAAKVVRLSVVQTQKRDSLTGTFKMPVDIELTMPDGSTRLETIHITDSAQRFTIVAPTRPLMTIFDKGNTILKELRFHKSASEWVYQLQHASLAIERSQAAMALVPEVYGERERELWTKELSAAHAFEALSKAAKEDPFWAVRQHALTSAHELADASHDLTALLMDLARSDKRPDNRAMAVEYLRHADAAKAVPLLTAIIAEDSSYAVVGKALQTLRRYDSAKAYTLALGYLATSSPRDRMRRDAITVIEQTNTHDALEKLIQLIGEHNIPKQTRWGIIGSIGSKVALDSTRVHQVLWALTENGDYAIRGTAANKLADLGDLPTLRQLETQAAARPDMKVTYDALLARMRKRLGLEEESPKH